MSWQLAAFAILALALAGGFWRYERSRPDARSSRWWGRWRHSRRSAGSRSRRCRTSTDVRHRADLRLCAWWPAGVRGRRDRGAGLQLLLWPGAVDPVADGCLGDHRHRRRRLGAFQPSGRPIGRWPLAIACGVCGFAFTAVQDAGDWITYSGHSFAQLGVYVGQGLGFDAIYAGSCVVFALAFGPALLRAIQRFTQRLEITWLPPGSSVAPALVVAVAPDWIGGCRRRDPPRRRRARPGGRACGLPSTTCGTLRTPTAASAGNPVRARARCSPAGRRSASNPPVCACRPSTTAGRALIAYIERGAGAADAGSIERNILVARAAGISAGDFGGHDLVAMLRAKLEHDGSVGDAVNLTVIRVLALRARPGVNRAGADRRLAGSSAGP